MSKKTDSGPAPFSIRYNYTVLLTLFRHGHSLSAFEAGVSSDRERPLSEKGRLEVKKSFSELEKAGFRPDLILTSPLLRALETAEIIHRSAKAPAPVRIEELSGAASLDAMWNALLSGINGFKSVIAVGHQPLLGMLAGYLCGSGPADLKPGGFVFLEIDASKGGNPFKGCAREARFYSPE